MKATFLRNENLLSLFSLNNFIIPEIQREYVWGHKINQKVLTRFLKNIKNSCTCCPDCHHAHSEKALNVGFLYSYKPAYITLENERFLDEYLIDGQQRMTTLFLLLFFLSVKEYRINDFLALFRFEEELKQLSFDYKVRDLTHNFIIDLLTYISQAKEIILEDILPIYDHNKELYSLQQTWFLSDYKNDATVQGILGALYTIDQEFNDNQLYFDYILTRICFWHFKTEATSQGEELYITMNSRGERLTENEEKKAVILPQDKLFQWGSKWEKWQDFFWKNRRENQNADKGFNEFINCIYGLEKLRTKEQHSTNIEVIKDYINGFIYLMNQKEKFKNNYKEYVGWVDNCIDEIWDIINNKQTDWDINYQDSKQYNNQTTERNRAIFLWSWMYYYSVKKEECQIDDFFRLLRIFYIRYKNNNRAITKLIKTIDLFANSGIWNTSIEEDNDNAIEEDNRFKTNEEMKKAAYFCHLNADEIRDYESVIWQIEDHPFNLEGIKNINSSHLIEYSQKPSLKELIKIEENFYRLFPVPLDQKAEQIKLLKSLLLHYKDKDNNLFWNRQSPWYYENYNCSDWERIVRTDIFKKIFQEIFDEDGQLVLDKVYSKKLKEFFAQYEFDIQNIWGKECSIRKQLIVYSSIMDIWEDGNIAIYGTPPENETRIFSNEYRIYGAKRYFNNNVEFWYKEEDIQKLLKDKLECINHSE